jgi:hypothetical protein
MDSNKPTMDDVVEKLGQEGALFTLDEITVLTDEIERMERELQDARYRAEATEADLAKFYECVESNGCYDDCGRVHIHDTEELSFVYSSANETMRTVYHKVGE